MLKYFSTPATLDLRSLSALRIAVAICLLLDLGIRCTDLVAHYTDQGVLPLEMLFRFGWLPEYFSVYNLGNSPFWTGIIFSFNFLLGILLLVGFQTRWVTALCWVFLVSIHNRNNLIGQGGDDLLRLLLFWGMMLPWGKYFSMDSLVLSHRPLNTNPYHIHSIAGIGYILLMFSMYFFSALLKNGSDWNVDFTALYYAYSLDMIVRPLGKWLLPYEQLLKVFTASAYYLELFVPFLLFIPWNIKWCRSLFIVLIIGFHLCIATTLFVGLFPVISIAALVGILPSEFWDKLNTFDFYRSISQRVKSFFPSFAKTARGPDPIQKGFWQSGYILKCSQAIIAFLVGFNFYLNYEGVGSYQIGALEYMRPIAQFLRIDQRWGMFAPIVFRDDGWFIFEATTVQKKSIDIYNYGKKVDFSKPDLIVRRVKNDRWRKYQENILFVNNNGYRPYYCQWLMREWNKDAPASLQIIKLNIIYMKEVTQPNYKKSIPSKEMLCECGL